MSFWTVIWPVHIEEQNERRKFRSRLANESHSQMIETTTHTHFMLKEIFEQPDSLRNTLRGRVLAEDGAASLGELNLGIAELRAIERIVIVACGTSWHSALIAEHLIEELAHIPVDVEYASEFRYREPLLTPATLVIAASQSGETADTLAAIRHVKRKGARVLAVCNVPDSTVARDSDRVLYINAGHENGVASTKAFTSQVAAFVLLAMYLGRLKGLPQEHAVELSDELARLPDKIARILARHEQIRDIARANAHKNNLLCLGHGINLPVALEGALKLEEVSCIHAEGRPAAEIKHGPIGVIDDDMPVVFICTPGTAYERILSNMEEVRVRRGQIIAVATEGDTIVGRYADHVFWIPSTFESLTPLLTVVPLQLFAYYVALARGCEVDQLLNLAKSVALDVDITAAPAPRPPTMTHVLGAEPPLIESASSPIPQRAKWRKAKHAPGGGAQRRLFDDAQFGIETPSMMEPGSANTIDVWTFAESWRSRVLERIEAGRRLRTKGPIRVPRQSQLRVRLHADGLEIRGELEGATSTIWWDGTAGNATFQVRVPSDLMERQIPGQAVVSLDGFRLVTLLFTLSIGPNRGRNQLSEVRERRYRTAFASYSSRDRRRVLARVHGLQKAGIEVFLDIAGLRSGARYESILREMIETRDVFYLFWSRAASESKWVRHEWQTALQTRGLDYIDPFPLESPEKAPPPPELGDVLHFNDWVLAYLHNQPSGRWWQIWRRMDAQ